MATFPTASGHRVGYRPTSGGQQRGSSVPTFGMSPLLNPFGRNMVGQNTQFRVPGQGTSNYADLLFQRTMAGVSSYMGARGMFGSTQHTQATVMARANAELEAFGMRERSRQQAFQYAQLREQRESRQQAWDQYVGSMSHGNYWNLIRMLPALRGRGAAPGQASQGGWQQWMAQAARPTWGLTHPELAGHVRAQGERLGWTQGQRNQYYDAMVRQGNILARRGRRGYRNRY